MILLYHLSNFQEDIAVVNVLQCSFSFIQCSVSVRKWQRNNAMSLPSENVIDKGALFCLLTDKIDSSVLEAGSCLRVVATMSVGHDHLGKA